MNLNTTATMKKASTALMEHVENTEKNMELLAKKLYGKNPVKMETVMIPSYPGMKDDVLVGEVNGVKFYFLRGKTVKMPAAVAAMFRNAGEIA